MLLSYIVFADVLVNPKLVYFYYTKIIFIGSKYPIIFCSCLCLCLAAVSVCYHNGRKQEGWHRRLHFHSSAQAYIWLEVRLTVILFSPMYQSPQSSFRLRLYNLIQERISQILKIINLRGDLTHISARTEPLVGRYALPQSAALL